MSQFPADPNKSFEADPFDELARLINGDAPSVPVTPSPVAVPQPNADANDLDIQAAMEGRPVQRTEAPAVPPMPVFDPSAPAPEAPVGLQQVPTRGPLARVAAASAPAAPAPAASDDSPLDAVFDLTALRAAYDRMPENVAVEPVPQSNAEIAPVAEPIAEPVVEAAPEPAFETVAPAQPAFEIPPKAYVPETEHAEIVTPPAAFAPTQTMQVQPEPASLPAAYGASELADLEAMMASEFAKSTPAAEPVAAEPDISIDFESELEAALMSDLSIAAEATHEPTAAPASHREFVSDDAMVAAPLVADAARPRAERSGSGRRAMALAAAVVMIGGGSAVAWSVVGSGESDDIPVVLADAGPTKMKPADAGGAAIPNRDTALFKEENRPHQDALRTATEQPVRVAIANDLNDQSPKKVKTQIRRALPPTARKVRTFTVKPDGTIVSDDAVVGAVAPRVAAPAAEARKVVSAPAAPKAKTIDGVEPQPVRTAAAATPDWGGEAKQDVPAAEPAPKTAVAPAKVAEAAVPKAPVAAAKRAGGGYVVQISSRRSPESARRAFSKLQKRYRRVLGERSAEYQKTEIDGKGTFYRVRVLADSKSDARSLCGSLKRAGGSCFVTR